MIDGAFVVTDFVVDQLLLVLKTLLADVTDVILFTGVDFSVDVFQHGK
jgi:hypothetical protein